MKRIFTILALAAISGFGFVSCDLLNLDDADTIVSRDSIFDDDIAASQNEFDDWIKENLTDPYNIIVKYRFEDKESNTQYNLAPADYDKSIALAKLTKYLWIDSYEELMGKDFVCTYAPKILNFIGSVAYNSQGSVVLGTAEGGMKITLYNVNALDPDDLDIDFLNYWFFKTMHHEFAHILHQTKSYSTDFNLISLDYQSASWVNLDDQDALDMGFISPYASSEPQEDFVELISIYVTNTAAYWNSLVNSASADGKAKINQKLDIVKDYLKTSWDIDIDKLRDIVQRRSGEIDTLDLTL